MLNCSSSAAWRFQGKDATMYSLSPPSTTASMPSTHTAIRETPLWLASSLKDGFTTVPARDADCPFISPEIGITSTPVIDPDTGRLYVLARAKDRSGFFESTYAQRLHALAVTTDVEKFGGPVEIPTATPRIRITEGKGGRIAAPGLSGSGRVWVMAIRRGSLWGC